MIASIASLIISHPFLLSFFGPSFLGGGTILVLGILSGKGLISPWIVLIFCSLGMLCNDIMWFLAGKIKILSRMKKYKWIHNSYKRAKEEIEVAPSSRFLLILIKFAYGIAIPILMYLGRRKMTLRKFVTINSTIIFLWSSAIVTTGWVIGKTSEIASSKFENIYTMIILVVTSLIIAHLVLRWIGREIIFKTEHRKVKFQI